MDIVINEEGTTEILFALAFMTGLGLILGITFKRMDEKFKKREIISNIKDRPIKILYRKINNDILKNSIEIYPFNFLGELEIEYDDNKNLIGYINRNFEINENGDYAIVKIINKNELLDINEITMIGNKKVKFKDKSSPVVLENESIAFIIKTKHKIKRINFLGHRWRGYIDLDYSNFFKSRDIENIDV
ncbi:Uncharacterised protein [[Clostridium] sordellii]|uniref:hypothetical protein n=1 Tax=Paraclostridium sordellii TaxID=1505 RepID=UPI0005E0354E|nr:hypothetical protein [Paeniclostridium sordellii]CEP45778.1 Uncharacterised protein [[Clostridium] sordellii] [Paeniclostridium sordellii]